MLCTCAPIEPCYCGTLCGECERKADDAPTEPVEAPVSPAFLTTAAIAQVARPAIVAWAETRRKWMEKRAPDLLAIADMDKFYARSILAAEIVRAYEAEIAAIVRDETDERT